MKIEIDTLRDSQEEIRKAIALLQALIEHSSVQPPAKNIFESPTPVQSAFNSLFDTPNETKKIEPKTEPKIEYYR